MTKRSTERTIGICGSSPDPRHGLGREPLGEERQAEREAVVEGRGGCPRRARSERGRPETPAAATASRKATAPRSRKYSSLAPGVDPDPARRAQRIGRVRAAICTGSQVSQRSHTSGRELAGGEPERQVDRAVGVRRERGRVDVGREGAADRSRFASTGRPERKSVQNALERAVVLVAERLHGRGGAQGRATPRTERRRRASQTPPKRSGRSIPPDHRSEPARRLALQGRDALAPGSVRNRSSTNGTTSSQKYVP